MAAPAPQTVQPDKAKGAEPRTQTHSEARQHPSWWTVTIASQVA